MRSLRLLVLVLASVVFTMCGSNRGNQNIQAGTADNKFDVIEVLQTNQYTYLQVLEGVDIKWVAVPKQEISKGATYYYDSALEMQQFHSKELDRTFEVIYFVNNISNSSLTHAHPPVGSAAHSGKTGAEIHSDIHVEKSADELTIARIFENPADFSGKEVEIRGVVVKINEGIMGTNWIHIQDGTVGNGKFDLTITCDDLPQLNQEASFRGIIAVNKDFGAGYFYDVIMENAFHIDKWRGENPAAAVH
jgi:hypothetical protein